MQKIKILTSENLHSRTLDLAKNDREITVELLHHLLEIDRRKLFLDKGYPSLFAYTVKFLGYSDNEAYSRIESMRLLRDLPEVGVKIQEGSISLTSAAKLQKFLKIEKKENRVSTTAEKMEIVKSLENKSTREVEKTLFKLNPSTVPQERVRVVSAEHTELKVIIDETLKIEIDQIKDLLSHRFPNMSYVEVIRYLTKLGLKELVPGLKTQRKATVAPKVVTENITVQDAAKDKAINESKDETQKPKLKSKADVKAKKISRYISKPVKAKVWARDEGCCAYIDQKTKTRCNSRKFIQYDHIIPFALGGEATVENIRLHCGAHNRRRAEKTFGRRFYKKENLKTKTQTNLGINVPNPKFNSQTRAQQDDLTTTLQI